ncbi:hypothetical protein [Pseudoalteromonas ostreae]|uniref:hypothetical protein n=1 Tax=Pseudoalteromonas ostreae TaxID=2774154 RepID=UPI001B367456|nr:hypothetical protein [Pseudoalteromonas ostreae]
MTLLEILALSLMFSFLVGFFLFLFPLLFFIKSKKLPIVEPILDNGKSFYLMNTFAASVGILHYGTAFFFDWYAKRYDLYEKRKEVPKDIQRWFIGYYILFMLMLFVFVLFCLVMHFGFDKT